MLALRFTPVARAQIALWLEREGAFVATIGLTEAVARHGIGNRPGASEMNSGFRWPYGRREGVLPVWARRRASQPGARSFRRVIFQRRSEGHASRSWPDSSPDRHFCLQLAKGHSRKDALDAMSCATVFSSDKGRFMDDSDLAAGYAEPYEAPVSLTPSMRVLSLLSLYPPRRDVTPCDACPDSSDVATYEAHALEVMPELDAVSMATPVGNMEQHVDYVIPTDWPGGSYRACLEINVEGDYNAAFGPDVYPTPLGPEGGWDEFAQDWGYPYRGQPSVVYCADFALGADGEQRTVVSEALGTPGSWDLGDPAFGEMRPMDDMTDDPVAAPGSGADRLALMDEGVRLEAVVTPPAACEENRAPSAVQELTLAHDSNRLRAHERVQLRFLAAGDDHAVRRYDVRVATTPIVDGGSFMAATPAREATTEAAALRVPTDVAQGQPIALGLGGLVERTHYFIAVRASDACAASGPIASAEISTRAREFATVTPCFVATAAYGSPLASEIGELRRLRDRELNSNAAGRWLVRQYEAFGPHLADAIRGDETRRAIARALLAPVVRAAELLGRD